MPFLNRFKPSANNLRFLKFLSCYKRQILILFLLSLVSSSFFLIGPFLSRLFIDKAFIGRDIAKFLNLSILGAVVFFFSTLVKAVADFVKNRIDIKLKLNLADKFIKKFYSLDLSFFQSKSVGENAYRLSDVETISNFLLEQCPDVLASMVKLPIILGISLWINPPMAISLFILSPLFLLHSVYLQKKLKPIYEEIWKYNVLVTKQIHEAFSKVLIIKALGLESFQRRAYLRSLIRNIRWSIKSFRWTVVSSVSSAFLSKAIFGAIALFGGWLIIKGKLTIGSYTAAMLYLNQLGRLLESLGHRFGYFTREMVSIERFLEVMDIQPQIKDRPQAMVLSFLKGEICFKNVHFGYQQEKEVFKGLNFTIPAFSWAGITGPSGCGKTTLINLILRLYDPWKGKILLDGVDTRMIKLSSLTEKMTIATQQPLLFDVSIGENISYGLRGIRQAEIAEAAKLACIHDFINQLPHGYDSVIGEDASYLSQGLKQMVAIARAVLRNPQLLILDEAASSVDSFTEEKIFINLRQRRQGLSTIIISHRLFSIQDADRIYFLRKDGKIEEGAHLQLLSESALYRDFFHNQIDEDVFHLKR
ncbi:MAG: ABC transporter ATP-binding protein [Candidatus Omnitrophota bacterium]